ncbi:hypothetical protein F4Z99_06705 [Candidatus Poribacteria bacterium]|nr:hypothetical protein [Candidatus Poribacteria bacterium]MYB01489.1 hypothetical protein [Candidatus Poribacteria bacterium]
MLNKIINLDKRIIFIFVAFAVIIPTLLKPRLSVSVSAPTQNVYDYIEALPPGATVMVSFDYGPSSMPEPTTIAEAVLSHCFSKGVKVIGMTLSVEGAPLADSTMKEIATEKGAVEGEDYVYLGFRPGGTLVILGIGIDIASVFGTDYTGKPVANIPIMQQITNYNDIDLLLVLASGDTTESWITYAHTKYNVEVAAGTTAVINTQLYPYLQTGQLVGLLNGYLGAAEYEQLTGEFGNGTIGINNATVVHLLIIGLVIMGNITYFIQHRRQKHLQHNGVK